MDQITMERNTRNCPDLGTGQRQLNAQIATQIVGAREFRSGIKITNLSGIEIWIGATMGVSPSSGDLLPAGRGQWLVLSSRACIFGIAASGTPTVSFAEVFDE